MCHERAEARRNFSPSAVTMYQVHVLSVFAFLELKDTAPWNTRSREAQEANATQQLDDKFHEDGGL